MILVYLANLEWALAFQEYQDATLRIGQSYHILLKESATITYRIIAYIHTCNVKTLSLVTKITNTSQAEIYFPDTLIQHSFDEIELDSSALTDFWYRTQSVLPSHCIQCFAVDAKAMNSEQAGAIVTYLKTCYQQFKPPDLILSSQDIQYLEKIVAAMRLTHSQRNQLIKYASSYKVCHQALPLNIENFLLCSPQSKYERAHFFKQLMNGL